MPISLKYPLIPKKPKHGEKVFASAFIHWNGNEYIYEVIEPKIGEYVKNVIKKIKEFIVDKIDVNFAEIKRNEAIKYLSELFDKSFSFLKIEKSINYDIIKYYIFRDFIGLEKIEPLMNDDNLEDISCDGVNIPIYVYHRNPRIGSIKTNIVFKTNEELDAFVHQLAERCGKSISVAKPLVDGILPDGSRVQVTLSSDIARRGSNFTIRKFTEKPLTPTDLIAYGTTDTRMMAYLWLCVEHGANIMISGGTATGKTTFLNSLALFIKPQMKIVSIEDTGELKLPHPHWVPGVARTTVGIGESYQVDMFELLRESLRQRPDYIIVGEVRGKEAFVLFQQMAVGHPGLSTIHAETFEKLIDRLTTDPISLPPSLIGTLDIILFLNRIKKENIYLRRVVNLTEVVRYDREKRMPIVKTLFEWDPVKDMFITKAKSMFLKKVVNITGMSENDIQEEIRKRAKILRWMVERGVKDYRMVSKIINVYYNNPEGLLRRIGD